MPNSPSGCSKTSSRGYARKGIARLIAHVRRFADQIERRVLRGKKIPHGEKVFSIFEEHIRRVAKGKAGTPRELGHEIMWTGGGADLAVPLIKHCRKAFPDLRTCSFDRGCHSPSNRLERLGLDRIRLRGSDGFERAIGLSVLALNFRRIGQILRERERRRMRQEHERMREERKRLERQRKRTQRERKPLHQYRPLRAA